MQYGFVIPGSDVPEIVDIAQEIEDAGWDGVFVAEGVYGTDAWVTLGAMAERTKRVRLGTLLTPPSRRRPWKLASEVATLDRLSGGRAVLSVGLGALDTGFPQVGEATDRKVRAELMDEGLEVMERLWQGTPFTYEGKHYKIDWDNSWSYTPLQKPRVPVWVVAAWTRPRSLERALRWDGILPAKMTPEGFGELTPEDVREIAALVARYRKADTPFDIVIEGVTPGDPQEAAAKVAPFAAAGATWWIESMWEAPGGMQQVRERISQGPPVPNA
jgi:alkanesulfonate monooxygenase SsuD/methylene tetrahydromethanopterin reductase-like flavin-dependent oxidoreductase (luciferase family)